MNNTAFQEALTFAQQVSNLHSPYCLCRVLGIEIISDKPLHKDGYLVCRDGCKLIFVNSLIHNPHRRKFIVSHEIGHFLLHRDNLYCYIEYLRNRNIFYQHIAPRIRGKQICVRISYASRRTYLATSIKAITIFRHLKNCKPF